PDLGEHGETITAENYRARALYWLYQSESASGEREWLPGTKTSFVGKLSAAMLKRLLQLGPADLLRFAPTLQRLFAEKHMLVSLHDERAARLLAAHGWDGRLDHASPDYLFVVDSTITYTKLAPFVDESITYQVELEAAGSARADVQVHYLN